MISLLEKKIIFRYLKPKKKENFLNVISIFSFIGISLGVAVLIIVMSVMNGFRSELINKIVGFNAHAVIKPYENKVLLNNNILKNLKNFSNNIVISNNSEGIVLNKDYTKGILIRGYTNEDFKKLDISKKDYKGNKNLYRKHISIGRELSSILNVNIANFILF